MMLIGYFLGISSERRLCQEVHLNLAYRWFCGLGLEDKVPDHSSFIKNRTGRFAGTTLFQSLFYAVVEQAMGKGLLSRKHLSVDATTVQANASLESMEPIVVSMTTESYWQKMEEQNGLGEESNASFSLNGDFSLLSEAPYFSREENSLFKIIRPLIQNMEFFFRQIFFQKYSAPTAVGGVFLKGIFQNCLMS